MQPRLLKKAMAWLTLTREAPTRPDRSLCVSGSGMRVSPSGEGSPCSRASARSWAGIRPVTSTAASARTCALASLRRPRGAHRLAGRAASGKRSALRLTARLATCRRCGAFTPFPIFRPAVQGPVPDAFIHQLRGVLGVAGHASQSLSDRVGVLQYELAVELHAFLPLRLQAAGIVPPDFLDSEPSAR
jgi:hypothetical protein